MSTIQAATTDVTHQRVTAAEHYRQILLSDPCRTDALCSLGMIARQTGQVGDAIALFRRALEVNPTETDAMQLLGDTWYGQAMLDEAVACYRRVLELNLDQVDSLNALANSLRLRAELAESVSFYQQAVTLKPNYSKPVTNLGLPELIAHTSAEYVRVATELRATLRARMRTSPLMDAPRFARNMETVYRQIWSLWCAGGRP